MAEHITCQEVVELVTDYLERALPADETTLFEQHIDCCDGCKVYVKQMRTTVGRVTEEDVPPETRERLVTAFREWNRRSRQVPARPPQAPARRRPRRAGLS